MQFGRLQIKPGPWALRPELTAAPGLWRGCVGAWGLGWNLAGTPDLSQSRHLATVADNGGGSASIATGERGAALRILDNNDSARMSLGSITSADPLSLFGASSCTIVFRASIRAGTTSNVGRRLIDKSSSGNAGGGWAVWCATSTSENHLAFAVNGAASDTLSYASVVVPADGQFRTFGISVDFVAGTQRFFRDGAPLIMKTAALTPPSTTTSAAIGNWNHSTDRAWDGDIDTVFVWRDRAFTDADHALLALDPYAMFRPSPSLMPMLWGDGGATAYTFDAGPVSISATAGDASLRALRALSADPAGLTASGQAAALAVARRLAAAAAQATADGVTVDLAAYRLMAAAPAALAAALQPVTASALRRLALGSAEAEALALALDLAASGAIGRLRPDAIVPASWGRPAIAARWSRPVVPVNVRPR